MAVDQCLRTRVRPTPNRVAQRRSTLGSFAFLLLALYVGTSSAIVFAQAGPAAATVSGRYALILDTPPVAGAFTGKAAMASREAVDYRAAMEVRHAGIRARLAQNNITTTGAVSSVLNAVFVLATPAQLNDLKTMPGVVAVVPLRRYRMRLNQATQLMNAPAAWSAAGGIQNVGAGIKVAVIDSGIDQDHPAFQDQNLRPPAGYPICSGTDCAFTNNKVIVARSYVKLLAAGSNTLNPAVDSRPDDYSPRDRVGHGTAVASAVAGATNTGTVTFSGMAPKAFLGNYKIYGSPGLNDSTTEDVIIQALEDAFHDGMDIISFSSGLAAFSGPLDTGAACGYPAGVPCDLAAQAFENVARQGVVIVAAAGNEGYDGVEYAPSYGTIGSPANAPSVIAAAASTNSHGFLEALVVPGSDAPANLRSIAVDAGDAYVPTGTLSAPLIDVTALGNNGLACSALPAASLVGTIALIQRGSCNFSTKLANAEDAGALGAVFYMADASELFGPSGLAGFPIPAVMISNADGVALKNFVANKPRHLVVIDPANIEQPAIANEIAYFSSTGPGTGDGAFKPDVTAVGYNVYMAGQSYDPNGEMYSANGYTVAAGTSFSTPLTSGAAALVKQLHPKFTAAQIKSALVNYASATILTDDEGTPVDVRATGGGKLDAGAAAQATVTVVPSVLSFGFWNNGKPLAIPLQVTNTGTASVTLAFQLVSSALSATSAVSLDRSAMTLVGGESGTLTVSLTGAQPAGGSFSGMLTMVGGGVSLHVPYIYTAPTGTPLNLVPMTGTGFDGQVNATSDQGTIAVRLVDSAGAPISGSPVSFTATNGGSFQFADLATNAYGIAEAMPILGPQVGTYNYRASAGGFAVNVSGYARRRPLVAAATGVLDAASLVAGVAVAPGSYVAIKGTNLSDFTDYAEYPRLPVQIDYAFVSFDVAGANMSVPAHLTYASPGQINIQVPWELQGQSTAQMKVGVSFANGNVVTVPLADYAPSFFEVSGQVAAQDLNYGLIGPANRAKSQQTVQLYANGLGPVTNQPSSGDPASAANLSLTTSKVAVFIGGQPAAVSFSGLAPGFAGLYQVNAEVPAGLAPGLQPITVSVGGKTSRTSQIYVQ